MNLFRKAFLLSIPLFFYTGLSAQEAAAIDSIKVSFSKATINEKKVNWMDELSRTVIRYRTITLGVPLQKKKG